MLQSVAFVGIIVYSQNLKTPKFSCDTINGEGAVQYEIHAFEFKISIFKQKNNEVKFITTQSKSIFTYLRSKSMNSDVFVCNCWNLQNMHNQHLYLVTCIYTVFFTMFQLHFKTRRKQKRNHLSMASFQSHWNRPE